LDVVAGIRQRRAWGQCTAGYRLDLERQVESAKRLGNRLCPGGRQRHMGRATDRRAARSVVPEGGCGIVSWANRSRMTRRLAAKIGGGTPRAPIVRRLRNESTKKEVSCSPQQEASPFWLFRSRVAPGSKTHSRIEHIGAGCTAALSTCQPARPMPCASRQDRTLNAYRPHKRNRPSR
jgi:hypothetical protein